MAPEARVVAAHMLEDERHTGLLGRGEPVVDLLARASAAGCEVQTLEIQPLSAGWDEEPEGTFKSGAAPIFALARAIELLDSGVDLVRIHGRDMLRAYTSAERAERMAIYDVSIPEAYTSVAEAFCRLHHLSVEDFGVLARALEANMRATASARRLNVAPPGTHDAMVTAMFRMVDCANPVINFEADVVIASSDAAARLGLSGAVVSAVAVAEIEDGPNEAAAISRYEHLATVLQMCDIEGLDPATTAMELYTCFPVVPLAFLWTSGWVHDVASAVRFLEEVPITLSGGMNFARAPWNNPALRGLVLAARAVEAGSSAAVVHGNGGVGGRQGCVVLRHSAEVLVLRQE